MSKPAVRRVRLLFVCVENAGRSQMAEGFARHYGGKAVEAFSAGSKPSGKLNPVAVEVMKELGIDISGQRSKGLKDLPKGEWDYVATMGCGDACPFVPARGFLEWELSDPKGKPIEDVRRIRDEIGLRVKHLIDEIKTR